MWITNEGQRLGRIGLTALLAVILATSASGNEGFEDRFTEDLSAAYVTWGAVDVTRGTDLQLGPSAAGGALVLDRWIETARDHEVALELTAPAAEGLAIWMGLGGEEWDTRRGVRVALTASSIEVSTGGASRHTPLPPCVYAGLPDGTARLAISWHRGHTLAIAMDGQIQASFYLGDQDLVARGRVAIEPLGRLRLSRIALTVDQTATRPRFLVHRAHDVGHRPYFVTSEDLDGNGRDDLLVTNRGRLEGQAANTTISVLYGLKSGDLAPARDVVVGKGPYTIEAGDIDGDAIPDLVVASFFEWGPRHLTLLSGAGLNGSRMQGEGEHAPRALFIDSTARHAAVALEGLRVDPAAGYELSFDLVCMKGASAYVWASLSATTLLNRTGALLRLAPTRTVLFTREPGGSWQQDEQPASEPVGPGDRIKIRVKGSRLDVLVADVTRATFDCTPRFPKTQGAIPAGTIGFQVSGPRREIGIDNLRVIGGDGATIEHADTFDEPTGAYQDLGGNARIRRRPVLRNPATERRFLTLPDTPPVQAKRSRWPTPGATSVVLRDFDGDGHLDLAAVAWTTDALHIYRGDGKGGFTLAGSHSDARIGLGLRDVRVGDIDGDGRLDLAVTCYVSNHVAIFQGLPGAAFRFRGRYPSGGTTAYHLALADLDADGNLDIAVGNYSGELRVLLGRARSFGFRDGGTYRAFGTSEKAQNEIRDVVVHDVDRDGHQDVLLACASPRSGYVAILHGTGSARPGRLFGRLEQLHLGKRPRSLWLHDFDGSGQHDLAVVRHDADDVLLLDGR